MPTYIYRGRYSTEAVKGMVANPEDRALSVAKLLEAAGGKLVAHYVTFGEDDFLVIAECPNDQAAAAVSLAVASGGSASHLKTVPAMTSKEAMTAFKSASGLAKAFKHAGR